MDFLLNIDFLKILKDASQFLWGIVEPIWLYLFLLFIIPVLAIFIKKLKKYICLSGKFRIKYLKSA